MSIETFSFPETATPQQIEDLLLARRYERVRDNPFFPGPSGSRHFAWWDATDYRSASGIDGSIYPLDAQGKSAWSTSSDWVIRLRTSVWASSFDKEFQNDTVRALRRTFGGFFHNDHFGRNRYTPLDRPKSTPVTRGIYALRERILADLSALENTVPEEQIQALATPVGLITSADTGSELLETVRRSGGSRLLYNALVPFVVASLEHFFSKTFQILLSYNQSALLKVAENRKVGFDEMMAVLNGTSAPEQIAASWFSFQNLDSVHKAFNLSFQIDFWGLIRRRKRISQRLPVLSEALEDLISFRHGIVHQFQRDSTLTRERLIELITVSKAVVALMSAEVERREGLPLGPG